MYKIDLYSLKYFPKKFNKLLFQIKIDILLYPIFKVKILLPHVTMAQTDSALPTTLVEYLATDPQRAKPLEVGSSAPRPNPQVNIVEKLLECNDVNQTGQNNNTPLHYAAQKHCYDIVKLLLIENDANVFSRNSENQTVSDIAKDQKYDDIIELIEYAIITHEIIDFYNKDDIMKQLILRMFVNNKQIKGSNILSARFVLDHFRIIDAQLEEPATRIMLQLKASGTIVQSGKDEGGSIAYCLKT